MAARGRAPGHIPFNRAAYLGPELDAIREAVEGGHLSGDGPFTERCSAWLEAHLGCAAALLVHSCTAGLEMAALLAGVGPGDEVVMPSFTFVSTANAVVLRGATPVFVDVRTDTFNLDESLVEQALTERTKAIMPVHYAGVGAEMDALLDIAQRHDLVVIEDAAQGLMADYRGKPLGSIGQLGAISFHETKNVTCGEGGALIVNDPDLIDRAEILREKGTNRSRFFRGQVDKYTWVDVGSSYVLSDLAAAFLWAQLAQAQQLTDARLAVWNRYHAAFEEFEAAGKLRRPVVPDHCTHNAHMYYVLLEDLAARTKMIQMLAERDVNAVFHYVPLHSAPAGLRYGRVAGGMQVTESAGDRLVRLPLWPDMTDGDVSRVISAFAECLEAL